MSNLQQTQSQQEVDRPRRVDLTISRIDPLSVLKIGFLLAVAVGIMTVVAVILLWKVLDGMNVFGVIEDFIKELGANKFLDLLDYVRLPRVISYATILGIANVIIFTAMSTVIALLYNLTAMLVGGIRISMMDE
jgi:Transmembrane domain of unknown function (DUF3566).